VLGKMATKGWIASKATEILKTNPTIGAKKLQVQLEQQFPIKMSYCTVWEGMQCTKQDLQGTWENSFKMLWSFKAQLEETCPGSIVVIDCKKIRGRMHFRRMFVAIKACVDCFLVGCRPYLGVDSTHLTGKYSGQLAAATSIDGRNWIYPIAYGIFDKEIEKNWIWFMSQLKTTIGTPHGLTIHTDACKGLHNAVHIVFQGAVEYRVF
jgi:zinc finger SWIM domain-containing protein 3